MSVVRARRLSIKSEVSPRGSRRWRTNGGPALTVRLPPLHRITRSERWARDLIARQVSLILKSVGAASPDATSSTSLWGLIVRETLSSTRRQGRL